MVSRKCLRWEKFDLPDATYVDKAILRAMGKRYCDMRSRLKKKFENGDVNCLTDIEEADWAYLSYLWKDSDYELFPFYIPSSSSYILPGDLLLLPFVLYEYYGHNGARARVYFSPPKVTVSTSGLVPQLKRFLQRFNCYLAVSLHATTDERLEAELEATKTELKLLKEREEDTEVAVASLNAELHKNMSKIAKAAAAAAAKAAMVARTESIRERERRMEEEYLPTVAQILGGGEEGKGLFGEIKKERGGGKVVDGLMALMEGEHVGPFNLGNPGEFTMLELAEVVKETIDSSATIEFKPNTADDPHKRKPDISKAKELLNWEPKVPLREGLPLMVADFRNRILNEDEGKGNK
ncbi:hypothetical protein RHMOL_Rhmol05G0259800 [Rhododendron molle]|uniref:Uncharacterized protein n=1 Tax=Rhododendron molle TaxID=49168 RepID=A0ACC0NT37_RHOML|nr:hypothetical protein RHMOL_Rhmol05G0259800 [Rhododendron molle]